MSEAFLYDHVRTPRGKGKKDGSLHQATPVWLLRTLLQALQARNQLDTSLVDDVVLGCVTPVGEQGADIARTAVLDADWAQTVAGVTVNRFCASGLEAVNLAAAKVMSGMEDMVVAGGVESMTRAPLVMPKPDTAFPSGNVTVFDSSLGWRFPNPKLAALFPLEAMGETAENLAAKYNVSRAEQDAFALRSHEKALAAQKADRFADELVAIDLPPPGKGQPAAKLIQDEGPRGDTSVEKLGKLPAAFRAGGSVTAGNSSTLNDGAAALLIGSAERAKSLGLRPLVRIVSGAVAGVDPRYMGIGPVPAIQKLLARTGLPAEAIGRIELNEAFAVQALSVLRELPTLSQERVNVLGGAIALGHPLGCSGARITCTLTHELRRSGERFGLAAMCIGVGQGIAALLENLDASG